MKQTDVINEMIKSQREKRFQKSKQLSLGELIQKIEELGLTYAAGEEAKTVCFDFGSAIPTTLDSWRGIYAQI